MSHSIKGLRIKDEDGYSILYTLQNAPTIEVVKHRGKKLYLYCNNLKPDTKYKIKLWYGSNHRGRAQYPLQHPYNSIYDAWQAINNGEVNTTSDYTEIQKKCTGSVMGVFNVYKCNNTTKIDQDNYNKYPWPDNSEPDLTQINPQDPEADMELLRKYILQTEWIVTTSKDKNNHILPLNADTWLAPLYRLVKEGKMAIVGSGAKRQGHLTFVFSLEEISDQEENKDTFFSTNKLVIGGFVDGDYPSYIAII